MLLLQRRKTSQPSNPAGTTPFLNWLFTAYFADGHTIQQDQSDKCLSREDGSGSTFTDVLAYEKSPLIAFALNHIDGQQTALVDLKSGAFSVNGTPVEVHKQFFEPGKYQLQLIYFRDNRVEQDVKATVQKDMSVKQENVGQGKHYVHRYYIGWQAKLSNSRVEKVILAVG